MQGGARAVSAAEPVLALACSSLATSVRAHIRSQNYTVLGQRGAVTYFFQATKQGFFYLAKAKLQGKYF